MSETARKEYIKAQAAVDTMLLNMSHKLGMIEAFRKDPDNWGDVGTMQSILGKLKEAEEELTRYYNFRLGD